MSANTTSNGYIGRKLSVKEELISGIIKGGPFAIMLLFVLYWVLVDFKKSLNELVEGQQELLTLMRVQSGFYTTMESKKSHVEFGKSFGGDNGG